MNIDIANNTAAFLIALGVIIGGFWRGLTSLRRLIDKVNAINTPVQQQLTRNGGGSLVNKADSMGQEIAALNTSVKNLQDGLDNVRRDLTGQHSELARHIGESKRDAYKRGRESEATSAAWIKYVFDHRKDHRELHDWLRETYGVDRRESQEFHLGAPERRASDEETGEE